MSIFLSLAEVIQEELIAGRLTVIHAKQQLQVNMPIAEGMEYLRSERRLPKDYSYTTADHLREKEMLDAYLCCGEIRGVD